MLSSLQPEQQSDRLDRDNDAPDIDNVYEEHHEEVKNEPERKSRLGRPWKRAINYRLLGKDGRLSDPRSSGSEAMILGMQQSLQNRDQLMIRRNRETHDCLSKTRLSSFIESATAANKQTHPQDLVFVDRNQKLDALVNKRSLNQEVLRLVLFDPETNDTVASVDRMLQRVGILLLSYGLGVWVPSAYPIVRRLGEYLVVAWFTCRLILLMTNWKNRINAYSDSSKSVEESNPGDFSNTQVVDYDNSETDSDEGMVDDNPCHSNPQSTQQPHPALESLYIIDVSNGQRFIPNSTQPFLLDNDIFHGQMLTLVRTPDVDQADAPKGTHQHSQLFVPYFAQRQRRFEFQWQIRLKREPRGNVFFGCELEEPVKMGVLQRTFVGAAMAFVKRMSPSNTFAYSITGSDDEKPHMAFRVEAGMPRIVVTKPGDTPPVLGQDLVEDPEHLKRRLKTGTVDWNTEDIYTMSMYSSYFDFLEWKTLNFPGIKPFGLASLVGPQSIHFTMYVLPFGHDRHSRNVMQICADLEISNSKEINIGPAAKAWIETNVTRRRNESIVRDVAIHLSDDNDSVDDESSLEEQTIVELGDGLYIRSGDPVVLEVLSSEKEINGFVCNGGGFAIVQESATAELVLEKAILRKKRSAIDRSLIRSGDTVMIKLIVKAGSDVTEYKYLSIHRGWWLKWVNVEPKNNGFFTVRVPETQNTVQETQNSFVSIGGSFSLQHKRWNGFQVGVRAHESATYGGRMLVLFDSANYKGDEKVEVVGADCMEGNGGMWMKPILFRAQLPTTTTRLTTPKGDPDRSFSFEKADLNESRSNLHLTTLNCSLDVPIWIEMLHRTERRRQLAYLVRVVVEVDDDEVEGRKKPSSFCRLRSGRALAEFIRSGVSEPKRIAPPKSYKERKGLGVESRGRLLDPPVIERIDAGEMLNENVDMTRWSPPRSSGVDDQIAPQRTEDVELFQSFTDEDGDMLTDDEIDFDNVEKTPRTKGRKIMDQIVRTVNFDQIARSVATNTAKTGKQVVKQSKKVGVTAGKVIIAPVSRTATALQHSKKPPTRDPKPVKVTPRESTIKRLGKESDFLAVSRTMRRFKKKNTNMWRAYPQSLAGRLSPSEQSLRSTSVALSQISRAPPSSHIGKHFEIIANAQLLQPTELDVSFLQGGAYQVGVIPPDDQKRLLASLVARCLWESHWREEWLGVYEEKVVLFTSGSNLPSLQLSYFDVIAVRPLDLNEFSPLPGYPIAVIETAWQCYYLAFPGEEMREEFCVTIVSQKDLSQESGLADKDLWKARFLQGFQDAVEATASTGTQKWAKIPSGSKSLHRSVMNGRRMSFDVESLSDEDEDFETGKVEALASKLVRSALSITFDTIERDPAAFSEFLDMTSKLRSLRLDRLDLSQQSTMCIFANIYHCLLQHALLLTVHGPLYAKSAGHFFRTSCYEIGGDVFSLAELYHCVLRGSLSKPVSPKIPYFDIPRKSSAYSVYALKYTDPRIAFILNTGDVSCPQAVPVLQADKLEVQLDSETSSFIQRHFVIDESRRVIYLPKLCEVYRNDFGNGDSLSCLSFCLRYLSSDTQSVVQGLTKEENLYTIKYLPCAEQYRQLLSGHDQDTLGDTGDRAETKSDPPTTESEDLPEFENSSEFFSEPLLDVCEGDGSG